MQICISHCDTSPIDAVVYLDLLHLLFQVTYPCLAGHHANGT
jgi:hypothetical protein